MSAISCRGCFYFCGWRRPLSRRRLPRRLCRRRRSLLLIFFGDLLCHAVFVDVFHSFFLLPKNGLWCLVASGMMQKHAYSLGFGEKRDELSTY